nr:MAG TPA: hypothetical protein [Caudoviricetes sp.]
MRLNIICHTTKQNVMPPNKTLATYKPEQKR